MRIRLYSDSHKHTHHYGFIWRKKSRQKCLEAVIYKTAFIKDRLKPLQQYAYDEFVFETSTVHPRITI